MSFYFDLIYIFIYIISLLKYYLGDRILCYIIFLLNRIHIGEPTIYEYHIFICAIPILKISDLVSFRLVGWKI